MNIVGIPALTTTYENYIWVMHDSENAWVVDPGEASQVLDFLHEKQLTLKAILITHKHHDHINGINALKSAFANNIKVYGPNISQIDAVTHPCTEGDQIELSETLRFKVLETPGHTPDHIVFYNDEMLFCGDTIFTGGCGRILGGTPKQFAESLIKLRQLPDELGLYSAHEYTQSNLEFAKLVEADNDDLNQRIANTEINYPQLHSGPQSTLGLEKQTNPFLRFDQPSIQPKLIARGAIETPESLFLTLREWKDEFDRGH